MESLISNQTIKFCVTLKKQYIELNISYMLRG